MRVVTNPTGAPHWDAHGRLIPPGGIIAFEEGPAPSRERPESEPATSEPQSAPTSQPESKGGKSASK